MRYRIIKAFQIGDIVSHSSDLCILEGTQTGHVFGILKRTFGCHIDVTQRSHDTTQHVEIVEYLLQGMHRYRDM